MATAIQKISDISHPPAPAEPVQASKVNYLDRYVEFMDEKTEKSHNNYSKMWKVAAIVSLVAFTAIAVGAVVVSGFFVPMYVPIVIIASSLLMAPMVQVYKKLEAFAEGHSLLAQQSKDVRAEHERLSQTMGLSEYKPEQLPFMAQLHYWKGRMEEMQSKYTQAIEEIKEKIPHKQDPDVAMKIRELEETALSLESQLMKAKTKAAFMYGLLLNPEFSEELDSLIEVNAMSFEEKALAHRFQDPSAEVYISFKEGRQGPSISYREAHALSIADLSDRIFAGIEPREVASEAS